MRGEGGGVGEVRGGREPPGYGGGQGEGEEEERGEEMHADGRGGDASVAGSGVRYRAARSCRPRGRVNGNERGEIS